MDVVTYIFIYIYLYSCNHDDVIKWKHFPRYWPFVRGIHRPPVNSPHKGQWRGALMFSLICVWINGWVNNCEAGDLRQSSYRTHYDVTEMIHFIIGCKLAHNILVWYSALNRVTSLTSATLTDPIENKNALRASSSKSLAVVKMKWCRTLLNFTIPYRILILQELVLNDENNENVIQNFKYIFRSPHIIFRIDHMQSSIWPVVSWSRNAWETGLSVGFGALNDLFIHLQNQPLSRWMI